MDKINDEKLNDNSFSILLLISVLVIATCGLIYELVAGTLASYLLGDSVTQFSTIIGVYLFAMGIGSFLSKYFTRNLLSWFVQIEIIIGVVGGLSSSALFILFEQVESFRIILYSLILITGILVGIEIPLLMRILKNQFQFKDLVSKVFTFDYIGALLASIIFPLILIPNLGLIRTSLFFGILNITVALILCIRFDREIAWVRQLKLSSILFLIILLVSFVYANSILTYAEASSYSDKIIFAKSSSYQRILVTKDRNDIRLYLNGNLQFSSLDEYRYHESLIHPPACYLKKIENVLVLGGGDGLAVREILKYPAVKKITLVDLDREITDLFNSNPIVSGINSSSLSSPKVTIINADAYNWIRNISEKFDMIVMDFPDPSNYSIGKLYSDSFYKIIFRVLDEAGVIVVQSTSPFVAPQSFWCIDNTLRKVGFITKPYHIYVPSFGDWGFIMAKKKNDFSVCRSFPDNLKFIDDTILNEIFTFPRDMQPRSTEVNKLNNQVLVSYFEDEWSVVN